MQTENMSNATDVSDRSIGDSEEQVLKEQAEIAALINYTMAQRYRNAMKVVHDGIPSLFGTVGYTKDRVFKWLQNPAQCERQLRNVSRFLFRSNGQYHRLCCYQPNMLKMAYVIMPFDKSFAEETDVETYKQNYERVAYQLDCMNIRTEANKLLCTANRDGVVYAYARHQDDVFSFAILDPAFCRISSLDSTGCLRYEFNFSYFDLYQDAVRNELLTSYGKEFVEKYALYAAKSTEKRWQEIGEDGICLKHQEEILDYSIPPFIMVVDNLIDLEDYRKLAKAREETGNYNLINFTVPTDKNGKLLMDMPLVKKFIEQASSEVPETIGVLYSPMNVDKISFSKETTVNDRNAVTEAVEQFWAASGVSELLFGSGKSSANALSKSIIADEVDIYPLMRQLERWINRRLRLQRGRKFKIKFLDVTSFNDRDMFDTLAKAGSSGMPVKTAMAATLGYTPYEVLSMAKLENDVLKMRDEVYNEPLLSSNTMSSNAASDKEGGRPLTKEDELSPEGEKARVNETNIRE